MTPSKPRVVSLLPSVTETLRVWRRDPAACTRFCEQPDLLHVGGTKDPDVAAIVALHPDLVVVDEEENRREDAEALVAAGIPLFVTRVRAVADVAPTLAALAEAVDAAEARALAGPVDGNPVDPAHEGRGAGGGSRVFVPIWRRPWMTINGDTYGSSLLRALGLENVFADEGERYPPTTLEAVASRQPDRVLAPSEPYPFSERHRRELEVVAPVRFVDGRDLFWWGVRTPAAMARLGSALAG